MVICPANIPGPHFPLPAGKLGAGCPVNVHSPHYPSWHRAKTLSEWEARAIAAQQTAGSWWYKYTSPIYADINITPGPRLSPPYSAKTLSEWEAWAIAAQQDRWKLVVICPANILGPPLAACPGAESVASAKKLLDGSVYPFVPPLGESGMTSTGVLITRGPAPRSCWTRRCTSLSHALGVRVCIGRAVLELMGRHGLHEVTAQLPTTELPWP